MTSHQPGSRRDATLDLRWLDQAFGRQIAGAETLETASGTTTRSRIRLNFSDGTSAAIFVKTPARAWTARAVVQLSGLARAEIGFYRDAAPTTPIPVAVCHHAESRRGKFVVVLDDLIAHGARFASLGDALNVDEVHVALSALARLHGTFWADPRLASADWPWCRELVPRFESTGGALMAPWLMRLGLHRARGVLPDHLRPLLIRYARRRTFVRRHLDHGPRTLVHHDCHPGNLAVHADGSVTLCDWQLVRAGPWALDVAYLMATGLEADQRREHERPLLESYLDQLGRAGGRPPSPTSAWQQYVANLAYPLEAMLITLALGKMQPATAVLQVVRRAATAVVDHDALGALRA